MFQHGRILLKICREGSNIFKVRGVRMCVKMHSDGNSIALQNEPKYFERNVSPLLSG